jgi:hypothetical protein
MTEIEKLDARTHAIIYWRAMGDRCGLRTGTVNPQVGEDWPAMLQFLGMSDPGCYVVAYTAGKHGDTIIFDGKAG